MENLNLKVKVWNINQRSGGNNNIPPFVASTINESGSDIVVLTEFVKAKNHEDFINSLSSYNVFYNSKDKNENCKNVNIVLIAVKKSLHVTSIHEIEVDDCNPNFLRVDINVDDNDLSIVGTRIRMLPSYYYYGKRNSEKIKDEYNNTTHQKITGTQWKEITDKFRESQFTVLTSHIEKIQNRVVVLGDFNPICSKDRYDKDKVIYEENVIKNGDDNVTSKIKDDDKWCYWWMKNALTDIKADIETPENGYSWVDKNNKPFLNDHIIAKNVTVTNSDYNWDFVNKINGYGNLKPKDYKSDLVGLPDHAILTAEICLNNPNSENEE